MSRYATNPEALPAELVRACSDQEATETWTCDACGTSANYLTRDPWIDQDGRRLCDTCDCDSFDRYARMVSVVIGEER